MNVIPESRRIDEYLAYIVGIRPRKTKERSHINNMWVQNAARDLTAKFWLDIALDCSGHVHVHQIGGRRVLAHVSRNAVA